MCVGALLSQGVHDIFVQLALSGGAEGKHDGCQRIHLLVLLQDLLVLRAALVVLLHPAHSHRDFHRQHRSNTAPASLECHMTHHESVPDTLWLRAQGLAGQGSEFGKNALVV